MPTGPLVGNESYPIYQLYNYFIADNKGKIYDIFLNEQEPYVKDGELYIDLRLNGGEERTFKVALLAALAFRLTSLDLTQIDSLDVMYIDGNKENLNNENLVLKYPVNGLEHPFHKGFYYIPGYSSYLINRKGEIKTTSRFTEKVVGTNTAGYAHSSMMRDGGFNPSMRNNPSKMQGLGRYRALGLTFLDYPANVLEMHVDHVDNDFENDTVGNLQFLSPADNVRKGVENAKLKLKETSMQSVVTNSKTPMKLKVKLPSNAPKQVYLRDITTGEKTVHEGLIATAKLLGRNNNSLRQAIAGIDNGLLVDGKYQVNYFDHFPDHDLNGNPIKPKQFINGRPTVVKNVITGEIKTYEKAAHAVRETGVSKKVATTALKNGIQKQIGDFIFQYEDQLTDWIK